MQSYLFGTRQGKCSGYCRFIMLIMVGNSVLLSDGEVDYREESSYLSFELLKLTCYIF